MHPNRQLLKRIAAVDIVLFLIAVALNNHSKTSFDGIVWWIALAVFAGLVVAGSLFLAQYFRSRFRRPRRTGVR